MESNYYSLASSKTLPGLYSVPLLQTADGVAYGITQGGPLLLPMRSLRTALRLLRHAPQSRRMYSPNAANEVLPYPESSSSQHHDFPSFLEYANRVDLDTASTVYVGTHYEYTVQTSLERLGMSLKRIGGASDFGIDILGTWPLPSALHPLKVIVQCKGNAGKFAVGPSQIRELEGAFVGAPAGWRGSGVLALLASKKSATKQMREAIGRSRWPMGYVFCNADGKILQILWNKRAEQEGLEGVGVEVKYLGGDSSDREVFLTYKGESIK